jgi:hypothetical protein
LAIEICIEEKRSHKTNVSSKKRETERERSVVDACNA